MDPQYIASHISEDVAIHPDDLLEIFLETHAYVDYPEFRDFCLEEAGVAITEEEIFDIVELDRSRVFHQCHTDSGSCWWPELIDEAFGLDLLRRKNRKPAELENPSVDRSDLDSFWSAMDKKDWDTALRFHRKNKAAGAADSHAERKPALPFKPEWAGRMDENDYIALDPGYQIMLHAGDYSVPGFNTKASPTMPGGNEGLPQAPPKHRVDLAKRNLQRR